MSSRICTIKQGTLTFLRLTSVAAADKFNRSSYILTGIRMKTPFFVVSPLKVSPYKKINLGVLTPRLKWAANAVAYCARRLDDAAMKNASLVDDAATLRSLGVAIRALRAERELSQEELAYLCSLDRSHMGRIERGERNVSILNLVRIAHGLTCCPSEILIRAGL
ncbi:helix-turn-helix transcriptional regulator [Massilia sp. MP_M2]|uniref:helix-turn-helix domain-containing protein n=1 Tax=Massilia sp. MP_M2 TaxID=3071713 RepID=UPI00319D8E5A